MVFRPAQQPLRISLTTPRQTLVKLRDPGVQRRGGQVGVNGALIGLRSALAGATGPFGGMNGLLPGATGAPGPQQLRSSHPDLFEPEEHLTRSDPRPVLSLPGITHSLFILAR